MLSDISTPGGKPNYVSASSGALVITDQFLKHHVDGHLQARGHHCGHPSAYMSPLLIHHTQKSEKEALGYKKQEKRISLMEG